ncbi:MAG: hypothetical protein WCW62_10330 [Bacteroidales bacterium]
MSSIIPAPSDLNLTKAEEAAYEIMATKLPKGGRTSEQKERSDHKKQLSEDLREKGGDLNNLLQEKQSGRISQDEYDNIRKNYKLTGI